MSIFNIIRIIIFVIFNINLISIIINHIFIILIINFSFFSTNFHHCFDHHTHHSLADSLLLEASIRIREGTLRQIIVRLLFLSTFYLRITLRISLYGATSKYRSAFPFNLLYFRIILQIIICCSILLTLISISYFFQKLHTRNPMISFNRFPVPPPWGDSSHNQLWNRNPRNSAPFWKIKPPLRFDFLSLAPRLIARFWPILLGGIASYQTVFDCLLFLCQKSQQQNGK